MADHPMSDRDYESITAWWDAFYDPSIFDRRNVSELQRFAWEAFLYGKACQELESEVKRG